MKAVSTLLKRLVTVEQKANLKDLKSELIEIMDLFFMVKENEELLDILTEVDGYIRKKNIGKLMEEKEEICKRIRKSKQKLLRAATESSNTEATKELLNREKENAALSLSHFQDLEMFKKRKLILWWIAVDCVIKRPWQNRAEEIESVFGYLLNHKLIVPYGNDKYPVRSRINPCIRHESVRQLLQNDAKSFRNFPQCMAEMKRLEVLQLGRWLHNSPAHHIEVVNEEFLKELWNQKHLKYLRVISRISMFPPSIFEFHILETPDLKDCHNLETLPDDIASLRKLRHLDLSHCYLLKKMPKGFEKLSELRVLKGFVIGSSKRSPCRISDLANLEKLEWLSIYIEIGALILAGELESLREFKVVKT
ncbi:unnamed protein product [Sphenostylis stenocarpa]|uniref:Disease resistance R13L4/SHOC-2-like LRR domain-containing protein n=1 Tax=Sphenostylis stenocarpa TaxID=92480 RepID=A0AA86T6K8_9FABA|nr:unnamed protein product [Sphenostylis stenocarpa]